MSHNIPVTNKMFTKLINDFDWSKASGHDYISVVVLKSCHPEFLYILSDLFKLCPGDIFHKLLFNTVKKDQKRHSLFLIRLAIFYNFTGKGAIKVGTHEFYLRWKRGKKFRISKSIC